MNVAIMTNYIRPQQFERKKKAEMTKFLLINVTMNNLHSIRPNDTMRTEKDCVNWYRWFWTLK